MESVCGRTGNATIGTAPGLYTGISMLPESGIADTKHCVTIIGAGISTGISNCGLESTSDRACISRFSAELRPFRVCDLRTIELVGSAQLNSAKRVVTDVGCRSRGAGTETDLLTAVWRPTLLSISTFAPLNQDGDVKRTNYRQNYSTTNCERNLTSPTENGKLSGTYVRVVLPFDDYQNQRWYHSTAEVLPNSTKIYRKRDYVPKLV